MVICLGQGADLHMAQLMPLLLITSCSSKSTLALPSWFYLSGAGSPGKSRTKSKTAIKWLCVCTNVIHQQVPVTAVNDIAKLKRFSGINTPAKVYLTLTLDLCVLT